jgi:hypothetical protein
MEALEPARADEGDMGGGEGERRAQKEAAIHTK